MIESRRVWSPLGRRVGAPLTFPGDSGREYFLKAYRPLGCDQEVMILPDRMKRDKVWALLGILIFLLLNYPLLEICNREALLGGIPVLVLYLHGVWLLAIAGLYAFSRLSSRE